MRPCRDRAETMFKDFSMDTRGGVGSMVSLRERDHALPPFRLHETEHALDREQPCHAD